MTNAEYVRSFLLQCPYIADDSPEMHIDFLENTPLHYSIHPEAEPQVLRCYNDGDTLRSYVFSLEACLDANNDEARAANHANYENLSIWLERMTRLRYLPPMREDARPRCAAALEGANQRERADGTEAAVYTMQVELQYYQKARN